MAMRPPVPSFCEIGSVLPAVVKTAGLALRPVAGVREPARRLPAKRTRRSVSGAAVNLRALIASSMSRARTQTGAAELVLEDSLDVAVPCAEEEVSEALVTVLLQAAGPQCAAQEGRPLARCVRISVRESGAWAEIRIRNASLILAEPDGDHAFAGDCCDRHAGSLADAYEIVVERHEGQMYMESDEARGTTFFVRLPLNPAPGGG